MFQIEGVESEFRRSKWLWEFTNAEVLIISITIMPALLFVIRAPR